LLQEVSVDSNRPWAFFDGASQENNTCCGGGAVLFLSNTHLFRLKMGLGPGTNNFAELMSLKLLLLFSLEKNVHSIQLFGDSLLVINWIRKSQRCHNIILCPLLEEVFRILASFDNYSFHHVYREHNQEADSLSKEGLQMVVGTWMIREDKDGSEIFVCTGLLWIFRATGMMLFKLDTVLV
jgi:ribonuclease HI